jgi:hypothetical protein
MPNRSTNFTPFFMVYMVEVVLPIKLQHGPPGSKLINRSKLSKHDRTPLTCSKNQGMSPSQVQPGISKHSDGTMHEGSTPVFLGRRSTL